MKLSPRGLAEIKRHEGFKAEPYLDTGGRRTVGFGHMVKPGEQFTRISRLEGEALLVRDVAEAERVVNAAVKVPLNQNQFDALTSFCFNVGRGKAGYKDGFVELRSGRPSTMLTLINGGQFHRAAQQFDLWINVNGVPSKGLRNRRAREKALFLSPARQPTKEG